MQKRVMDKFFIIYKMSVKLILTSDTMLVLLIKKIDIKILYSGKS
jgi:hypothetical protein